MIVRKRREGEGGKEKKIKKPLVFGLGHLLHSRDCENGRRDRVCVNHCVGLSFFRACMVQVCVSALVLCCHLKRRRQDDAFKPSGEQRYKDEYMKCLPLI